MKNKIKIGIDINEILRAKWLQFDRYYVEEFGEEGAPKVNEYSYDYFNTYKWNDTVEVIKELKEPEEMPDNINPIDYQVDEVTGEAPADFALFKPEEKKMLSAKEVYNRFMYEDYLFEIHGSAPAMYRGIDLHVNQFIKEYGEHCEFVIKSVENNLSIPSTLFFLSKINSRFKKIEFVSKPIEMWNGVDVLITTDPEVLKFGVPWFKKLIKVDRPYNTNYDKYSMNILQIADLINNQEFEKIIKFKKSR